MPAQNIFPTLVTLHQFPAILLDAYREPYNAGTRAEIARWLRTVIAADRETA